MPRVFRVSVCGSVVRGSGNPDFGNSRFPPTSRSSPPDHLYMIAVKTREGGHRDLALNLTGYHSLVSPLSSDSLTKIVILLCHFDHQKWAFQSSRHRRMRG